MLKKGDTFSEKKSNHLTKVGHGKVENCVAKYGPARRNKRAFLSMKSLQIKTFWAQELGNLKLTGNIELLYIIEITS